jgi:hypothetical protein
MKLLVAAATRCNHLDDDRVAYAAGDDVRTVETNAAFADVATGVENAIVNRGLHD